MSDDEVATIGDFADGGYILNVWCDRCKRGGVIGMEPSSPSSAGIIRRVSEATRALKVRQ